MGFFLKATGMLAGLWMSALALAQAPPIPPQGTPVAVVDLPKVFANHLRFQAALNDLKNDLRSFQSKLLERQRQAADLQERLKAFKSGTPEYKQVEEQLSRLAAGLQADTMVGKRELATREAKLYYDAYLEVVEQVADFARRRGIALVLVNQDAPLSPEDRRSLGLVLSRHVLYHRGLDITPQIIERLNRGVAPPEVSSRPIIPQRR